MKKKDHRKSKWIVWLLVFIVSSAVLYLVGSTSAQQPSSTSSTTNVEAPQFALNDIDGHSVSLSNYRGKVVLLDFWASWCPPCKREIPDFISLQNQYAKQGLQIIGIGLDQPNNIVSFVRQHAINYPVIVGDEAISRLYGGISGIPTTFIIDKQGNIINKFEGFTNRTVFEEEIKKLL